jgi:peptide/nickel transport system permease protein
MAIRLLINIARFVVTYLVATIVVFLFMRLIPGDPAQVALGVNATPELLAETRKQFGTDRPLIIQYFDWAGGLLVGDFGTSFISRTDISPMVADRLQVSLILVVTAMVVALVAAIPLGTLAAVKHRNLSGVLIGGLSQVGVAIPGFLAGILLVLVFAVRLGWLPAGGWTPPAQDIGEFLSRLVLPVLALASVQGAILTRYVRSAVLEIMSEDYLRTARSKGLSKTGALLKHGMRNAAIPVITVTGVQLAALIIGAVVIERVFVIPGLGSMLLDAVGNRDLLTVQSVVMVLVAITLIMNLLIDVAYTIVDPRMRKGA